MSESATRLIACGITLPQMKTRCRKVGCENAFSEWSTIQTLIIMIYNHHDDQYDYRYDDVGKVQKRSDSLTVLQGRAAVMKLLWGCDDDIARIVVARRQQQQQQHACPRPLFDLIVGSDLLYNPDAYPGCITSPPRSTAALLTISQFPIFSTSCHIDVSGIAPLHPGCPCLSPQTSRGGAIHRGSSRAF
jgi:hypothetical protein